MKYGIVTPVLNEIANLHDLLSAIVSQRTQPHSWVIVDNGSQDGSLELLRSFEQEYEFITVIEYSDPIKEYKVGWKYARIINYGFESLQAMDEYRDIDALGILDADVFPENDYYYTLCSALTTNRTVGIVSGQVFFENGDYDGELQGAARGNCRLWRKDCFNDAGYVIGPSADALSAAKAEIRGWQVRGLPSTRAIARKMGKRVNYSYYGESTHYRGVDPFVAFIKVFRLFFSSGVGNGASFFQGYFVALIQSKERIADKEIRKFFARAAYCRAWLLFVEKFTR